MSKQELINKETPKWVICIGDGYSDGYPNGYPVRGTVLCPNCERIFKVHKEEHYKYCPTCGQKLKWEEKMDKMLEEITEEWEEKGYEWSEYSKVIHLSREKFFGETIVIRKEDLSYYKIVDDNINCIADYISLDEHELLTKTLKILRQRKNDN